MTSVMFARAVSESRARHVPSRTDEFRATASVVVQTGRRGHHGLAFFCCFLAMAAKSSAAGHDEPHRQLWYWIAECPCHKECTVAAWKRARVQSTVSKDLL